jgi:ParB/RepB/Spo0J family partition protein
METTEKDNLGTGPPGAIRVLPLDCLLPDPEQARKVFGERRYRAARQAGLRELPCVVHELSDQDALTLSLCENLVREDLSDLDKSDALQRLKELTGLRWKELAERVQLSHDRVRELAGLQKLDARVKEAVRRGEVSGRMARALKPLPPEEQREVLEEAVREKLTRDEVRLRVERRRTERQRECGARPTRRQHPFALRVQALAEVLARVEEDLSAEERAEVRAALEATLARLVPKH